MCTMSCACCMYVHYRCCTHMHAHAYIEYAIVCTCAHASLQVSELPLCSTCGRTQALRGPRRGPLAHTQRARRPPTSRPEHHQQQLFPLRSPPRERGVVSKGNVSTREPSTTRVRDCIHPGEIAHTSSATLLVSFCSLAPSHLGSSSWSPVQSLFLVMVMEILSWSVTMSTDPRPCVRVRACVLCVRA